MPTDDHNERLILDGAIDMTVSEKALQEAETIGVDAPKIDRTADDNGISLLDFLIVWQEVVFIETYPGLGAELHAPFAARVVQLGKFDEFVFMSASGHNRFDQAVGITLMPDATGTEADNFHVSPQKNIIKTNCSNMRTTCAIQK